MLAHFAFFLGGNRDRRDNPLGPIGGILVMILAPIAATLVQLAISRTLVDLQLMREFQETVIEIIQAESPETARRLVGRLKERRALRPSADLLPSLDPSERARGHVA